MDISIKRSVGISICLYIVLLDPTDYFREGIDEVQLLLRSISTLEAMQLRAAADNRAKPRKDNRAEPSGNRAEEFSPGRQGTPVAV